MLPSITLCCWVSPHRKKSYVSMWKNAASALAAAIIIDGVVNHCGDEVCKWTRMAMGRLVWYTCCKWQEQCKAHSMWHKFCNNRILSQRPPQSVEYHCLLLARFVTSSMYDTVQHMPTFQDSVARGRHLWPFNARPSSFSSLPFCAQIFLVDYN